MKVIEKYILGNFFRYLIFCLAVLVFIYIIINLFENLGKYLAKNAAALDVVVFYLYHIPSYVVLLVPVASIMAVFFIFGFMTKNKELFALKVSGLNTDRLFLVIVAAGLLIALAAFAFQETVGVWAQGRRYEYEQYRINRRPRDISVRRRNFFYYGDNNWIYFIRDFDGAAQRINGAILWQINQSRVVKRIDAEQAYYDTIWNFAQATVRQFDKLGNETSTLYPVLPLPELAEEPADFSKRIKPIEEMNFVQIARFVRKRSRAGENIAREAVELNYRFSFPMITIITLLITLPLSVVLKKGGIAIGLGISIGLAFAYWGAIQSCRAYGVAGLIDPLIAAWIPNIFFGFFGLLLIAKVPR